MKTLIGLTFALLLAGCGGLEHAGQVSAKGTTIGLGVGTDPASGGVQATLGYRNGSLIYNPNSLGDETELVEGEDRLISADRGGQLDSRSIMQWDDVTAGAGSGDGVSLGLGSGVATGWAAYIVACGAAGLTNCAPQ